MHSLLVSGGFAGFWSFHVLVTTKDKSAVMHGIENQIKLMKENVIEDLHQHITHQELVENDPNTKLILS